MSRRGVSIVLFLAILASWQLFRLPDSLPGRADLVIGNGTDPGSLHPHRATGIPEGRIIGAIHEGLVLLDPVSHKPIPGCAESWQVSASGTRWSFQLSPGLQWSDGTPLNAHDFRRSWLDLLDPAQGAPYGDLLELIVGAKEWRNRQGTRDQVQISTGQNSTLVIELKHPAPWFPFLCAQTPLQPVHPQAAGRAGVTIPTNGPWILKQWRLRDRIRIEANPYYRGPANPSLQTIDFLAAESGNTILNIFAAGMADWAVRVPAAAIPVLRTDPSWSRRWRADPYLGISFYRLNLKRPPLDDPAVRRALSLAIDRAQLCQDVLGGDPEPAYGFTPWPSVAVEQQNKKLQQRGIHIPIAAPFPAYNGPVLTSHGVGPSSEISSDQWPTLGHDPDLARKILREAGWQVPGRPTGKIIPSIEILHPSGGTNSLVAQWLQLVWKRELGLDTRIRAMEWRSFLESQRSIDYDISRSTWIADYPDPATFLTLFTSDSTNNRTGWSDLEYDRLVALALDNPDPQKRQRFWYQAEKILLEKGPVLPLWSMTSGNLVSQQVTGFHPNPLDQHDLRSLGRREP
ncbi:MAG: peptide ABC transporter substrate-binding protein [Planctomycetota bacterium]